MRLIWSDSILLLTYVHLHLTQRIYCDRFTLLNLVLSYLVIYQVYTCTNISKFFKTKQHDLLSVARINDIVHINVLM